MADTKETKTPASTAAATPAGATAAPTERPNYQCIQTMTGHTRSVSSVKFSVDGLLATASSDKTIRLWDGAEGKHKATLNESIPVCSDHYSLR
jgi:COMPASS component SWD3